MPSLGPSATLFNVGNICVEKKPVGRKETIDVGRKAKWVQNRLQKPKRGLGHSGALEPCMRTSWALVSQDQNVQMLLGVGVLTWDPAVSLGNEPVRVSLRSTVLSHPWPLSPRSGGFARPQPESSTGSGACLMREERSSASRS